MEIASCYLEGNADAVEFCPHEPFHHVFAAATYTLHEKPEAETHRVGTISLFSCSTSSDADDATMKNNGSLQLLCREETPGIFDIKWSPGGDGVNGASHPLLALADADGFLTVRRLQADVTNDDNGNLNFVLSKPSCISRIDCLLTPCMAN
jgi:diphthine methyl ester acylhydrolase